MRGFGSKPAWPPLAAVVFISIAVWTPAERGRAADPKAPSKEASAKETLHVSYQKWRKLQASGDYFAAFQQAATALETVLKLYPRDDVHTARVLSEMGELQVLLNNFPEAKELLTKALAIRRKEKGDDHLDVGDTQLALGKYFVVMREPAPAADALAEAIRIFRAHEGHENRVAETLLAQALLATDSMRTEEAEKSAREALAICGKLSKPDPMLEAEARVRCGHALHRGGKYREALDQSRSGYEALSKLLGPEHPRVLWARYYLTQSMDGTGSEAEATRTLYEILSEAEERLGPDHFLVAFCHNDLGIDAKQRGDYATAKRHLMRALEIKEQRCGDESAHFALAIENLANLYSSLFQLRDAKELYDRALEIYERIDGPRSARVASTHLDLGVLWSRAEQHEEAEAAFRKSCQIYRESLGESHPKYALAQWNLATTLFKRRKYDEAQEVFEVALTIYRETCDPLDDGFLIARTNLAILNRNQGKLDEARSEFMALLSDLERAHGPDDWTTINVITELGVLAAAADDWKQVLALSNRERRTSHRYVATVLPTLSAQAQLRYLRSKEHLNHLRSLRWVAARPEDQEFLAASAEWQINGKGISLETLTRQTIAARDLTDEDSIALRNRILDINRRIAGLMFTSTDDEDWVERVSSLAELEADHTELSEQLADRMPTSEQGAPWIDLASVRVRIPADAVLVELGRVQRPENEDGEFSIAALSDPHYVAWIIPPAGKGDLRFVDLGLAERVDEMTGYLRSALFASLSEATEGDESAAEKRFADATGSLSRSLLAPLEKQIGGVKHWILCPDGMTWLVPWGALQYAEGDYVIERHPVSLVSTSREFVKDAAPRSTQPALLVADPNYNLGLKDVPEPPPFALLPQTADEAKSIVGDVEKITNLAPRVLLGDEAREETVKAVSRPSLVMFSTHGFSFGGASSAMRGNPLMWCGLAFAGANGRQDDPEGEDGVLTGLEVVGLDLRGTRLVVLSACDTGVGQVTSGEGVASLQQAFLLAGAQQVVSTIWPVPVEGTVELVIKFFDTMAAGQDASTALREAQLQLIKSRREKVKGAHPMHWGAFTVTGWSPNVDPPAAAAAP